MRGQDEGLSSVYIGSRMPISKPPTFSARWRAVGNCIACLFIMKMQLSFDSAFVPFPLFAGTLGSSLSA